MGTFTSKRTHKQSTVVVDPAQTAAQDGAQPAAQTVQEGKVARKKRNRKPLYTGGAADGKPARGLTATPEGYTPAQGRLVRGQFKTAAHWYTHCAVLADWHAAQYRELAADATANPEKYKRANKGKAVLQEQLGKLQAALAARGFSAEDIAAMLQ